MFINENNVSQQFPPTREAARLTGSSRYDDGVTCSKCGSCSLKFYISDACTACTSVAALDYFIQKTKEGYPTTAGGAISKGLINYVSRKACKKAGHVGLHDLRGRCVHCVLNSGNPRADARNRGDKTYVPLLACPQGHYGPRNVQNDRCLSCHPPKNLVDSVATPSTRFMRAAPDTIISRKDAKVLGLTVFRTGNACNRGHTGWRAVSNRACIECMRNY